MYAADGDWKIHASFDNYFQNVYEGADKVYIIAYGQMYNPNNGTYNKPKGEVFVHDKATGETLSYNARNYLSGNIIQTAQYNPMKGYLCIIYNDGNIDLLYDDDKVVNIPSLKNTTLNESKTVNNISFSLDDNLIYLATNFGFIVIDPETRRINKAKNYHQAITSICRVGKKLILTDNSKYYIQDYDKALLSLNDFNVIQPSQRLDIVMPLTENRILAICAWSTGYFQVNEDNTLKYLGSVETNLRFPSYSYGKSGYTLSGTWAIGTVTYDLSKIETCGLPKDELMNFPINSYDFTNYYTAIDRKGVRKYTRDGLNGWGTKFGAEEILSRPNSPSPFLSEFMCYSDKYGLMTQNESASPLSSDISSYPTLISGLKNGVWSNYGPVYLNSPYAGVHTKAKGLVQDPINPNLFYSGSYGQGLQIMDIANPNNTVNIGVKKSPASYLPNFYAIKDTAVETATNKGLKTYMSLSEPAFDNDGNLWVANHNLADSDPLQAVLVWPAATLKAKKYSDVVQIKTGFSTSHDNRILPLKAAVNKNLVLVIPTILYNPPMLLLDHKGTLENCEDDRQQVLSGLYNQDGGAITQDNIYWGYEDPNSGTVWIGTSSGLFTIQPSKMFDNPTSARRIKISRNDGTNMADYLLDGIDVRAITVDGNGNKWFATFGAGVVQTSPDGTHVMRQLTTENSYLPSNETFQICYNKESNSMMIGTADGIAEYFLPGSSTGSGFDQVKIYPNPVRPDFIGYITIEGLLDNALVKICDSEGNLVKELGSSLNGVVKWDGTNITGANVNSGVYYVFMSQKGENASEANVGKVVIVR